MLNSHGAEALRLLARCLQTGTNEDWQRLTAVLQPLIMGVAYRTASRWQPSVQKELVDDLAQEIFLKLLDQDAKALRRFTPTGPDSLFSFVKVIAANHVFDRMKSRVPRRQGGDSGREALTDNTTSAPNSHFSEQRLLVRSIEDALIAVTQGENSSRDRAIFLLHYRHGLTAEAIAKISHFGLSTKGVESTVHRLRASIRRTLVERRI